MTRAAAVHPGGSFQRVFRAEEKERKGKTLIRNVTPMLPACGDAQTHV